MRYDYDMLGNRIHQLSMEAGARWMLNDVAGKPHPRLGQPRPQLPHRHTTRCAGPSSSSCVAPTAHDPRRAANLVEQHRSTARPSQRHRRRRPTGNLRGKRRTSASTSAGVSHQRGLRLQGQPAAQHAPACAATTRATLDWSQQPRRWTPRPSPAAPATTRSTARSS